MRTAILSDVHANAMALRAVLDDIDRRDVRAIACLGDSVGYGAEPGPCLDLLFEACTTIIAGNHDLAASGRLRDDRFTSVARHGVEYARRLLSPAQRARLAQLPEEDQLGDLLLVHASPNETGEFPYIRDVASAERAFASRSFHVAVYGHTHVPLVFHRDGGRVTLSLNPKVDLARAGSYLCNVGSVGQPRDQDPRACYAIYDGDARTITFHRVQYDVEAASDRIRSAGLPEQLGARLLVGV